MRRSKIKSDDRAIEGLPIRLVIALVVGVAALGIMMQMLGGLGGEIGSTEVTVDPSKDVVSGSGEDITMNVITEDGETVENATVVIKDGTATVSGGTATIGVPTGSKGGINIEEASGDSSSTDINVKLNPGQDIGTIKMEVYPPDNSKYAEKKVESQTITVTAG
jgi:hypothetical protein